MRLKITATTLALSLAATTAMADSNLPQMQMDEQMIVKQMGHESFPGAENTAIIVFIMLVILAAASSPAAGAVPEIGENDLIFRIVDSGSL